MKNQLIFLIALLSSCSFIDDPIYSIDPEIEFYYDIFIEEGKNRGVDYSGRDIIMYFGDLDGLFGLHVTRNFDNVIEIVIDRESWDNNNIIVKQVTVYHELGHALLYRDHNSNCESIMATGLPCKYNYFRNNREEMFDELFN